MYSNRANKTQFKMKMSKRKIKLPWSSGQEKRLLRPRGYGFKKLDGCKLNKNIKSIKKGQTKQDLQ